MNTFFGSRWTYRSERTKTLPPAEPGSLRFKHTRVGRVLWDRHKHTLATLKEGDVVEVDNLPGRFKAAWGLKKPSLKMKVILTKEGELAIKDAEARNSWNALVIPLKQLSGKALLRLV